MARPRPVPPCRRVGGGVALLEGTKQKRQRLGRNPHAGVADQKLDLVNTSLAGNGGDFEADLALVGEFDGVTDEVDEDLPDAGGVTEKRGGNVGADEGNEIDFVPLRGEGEKVHHLVDAGVEGKGLFLQRELAGLNLGEVEDLVDETEQGISALADGFDIFPAVRS